MKTYFWTVALAMSVGFMGPAQSQEKYPTGPITVVLPVEAGTGGDIVMRTVAEVAGAKLGQPIIVENLPGAGGAIGAQRVARAEPNGYTLGMFNNAVHTMLPNTGVALTFDPWKDFKAVALLVESNLVLIASPKFEGNSVSDMIALAKKNPNKLNFGSNGHGSPQQFAMVSLMDQAGIEMQHIPYKGGSQATMAVSQNEIDVFWINTSVAMPFIEAKTVKALGVGSRERASALPDVPTVREQGLPNYEYMGRYTVFAPAGTPDAIIKTLYEAFAAAIADPKVSKFLSERGFTPKSATGEEVTAMLKAEDDQLAPIVRRIMKK